MTISLLLFSAGCRDCYVTENLPITPPTSMIAHEHLIFEAASMPPVAEISVQDRFPLPHGDGRNDLWIPWSENGTPPALFARISVDSSAFPAGVSVFRVKCAHYSSCHLQGLDKAGNPVGGQVSHSGGVNTAQTLEISGSNLSGFEVRGAEIAILEVCFEE